MYRVETRVRKPKPRLDRFVLIWTIPCLHIDDIANNIDLLSISCVVNLEAARAKSGVPHASIATLIDVPFCFPLYVSIINFKDGSFWPAAVPSWSSSG